MCTGSAIAAPHNRSTHVYALSGRFLGSMRCFIQRQQRGTDPLPQCKVSPRLHARRRDPHPFVWMQPEPAFAAGPAEPTRPARPSPGRPVHSEPPR